ncbi:hypothetical protein M3Y99_01398300 [Aphelenchoides fujianensis]|nr:hypothetical protein M3Y99_01398300 [Aphelenchoides fujianensis]
MGCGASLSANMRNAVVMHSNRSNKTAKGVTLASTFDADKVAWKLDDSNALRRRLRNPCFIQLRGIFRSPSQNNVAVLHVRRRRRRTEDCRFIEQRIPCDSESSEVDDGATNSTTVTCISPCAPSSHNGEKTPVRPQPLSQQHPRSFFRIAMDYNRRIEEIKSQRPRMKADNPGAQFSANRAPSPAVPQEAAILQHTTRRDFLQSTCNIPTPPPALIRRVLTPTRMSISDSKDTLSENSFIVVHNTLKVAWEKELYPESIPELSPHSRALDSPPPFRWRGEEIGGGTKERESLEEAERSEFQRNQRAQWTQQLEEIVRLD